MVNVTTDPVVLAAGDRYVVTLYRAGDGHVLGRFERRLRYEESYPNGQACDVIPCRRAVVTFEL